MTFYQQLKEVLKDGIEDALQSNGLDFKVTLWNDVTNTFTDTAPKENEINLVIKTGLGTTSKVKDLVMTSYPINITGILDQNSLQDVLSILCDFTKSINGKVDTLEEGSKTHYFTLGLDEPSTLAVDRLMQGEDGEVNTALISWMGTCTFSEEDISPPTFTIVYNSTNYEIKRFISYTESYASEISTIKEENQTVDDVVITNQSLIWSISLRKGGNSTFDTFLDNWKYNHTRAKITLKKGSKTFTCVIKDINEVMDSSVGIPIYSLTLMEVRS